MDASFSNRMGAQCDSNRNVWSYTAWKRWLHQKRITGFIYGGVTEKKKKEKIQGNLNNYSVIDNALHNDDYNYEKKITLTLHMNSAINDFEAYVKEASAASMKLGNPILQETINIALSPRAYRVAVEDLARGEKIVRCSVFTYVLLQSLNETKVLPLNVREMIKLGVNPLFPVETIDAYGNRHMRLPLHVLVSSQCTEAFIGDTYGYYNRSSKLWKRTNDYNNTNQESVMKLRCVNLVQTVQDICTHPEVNLNTRYSADGPTIVHEAMRIGDFTS